METHFYNIINDELRGSEKTHQVTDPRTEEELWPCPIASNDDFEDAVAAAQRAFTTWSKTTVPERQAMLVKLADAIKENAEELASILMKETGKSVCHHSGSINVSSKLTPLQKILADIDVQAGIAQCLYYCQFPPTPNPTTH